MTMGGMTRPAHADAALHPMHLDVVTANLHVVSHRQPEAALGIVQNVRQHFGRWPDVVGCQEGIQIQQNEVIGSRYQVVATDKPTVHDNTNVVLLKRKFEVLDSTWHFGAPPFGDGLNHRQRNFHVVTYRRRARTFAAINAHLSVIAEPRGRVTDVAHIDSPVVRTHGEMAVKVADAADAHRDKGHIVTVTADSNDNTGWDFALRTVLERRGYLVFRNGIDLVAVHRSQAKPRDKHVVIPRSVTHSDHEAYGAAFDLIV